MKIGRQFTRDGIRYEFLRTHASGKLKARRLHAPDVVLLETPESLKRAADDAARREKKAASERAAKKAPLPKHKPAEKAEIRRAEIQLAEAAKKVAIKQREEARIRAEAEELMKHPVMRALLLQHLLEETEE